MSEDELVARFADAGLREHWTRHCGGEGDGPKDIELCNKIVQEIRAVSNEIKRRGALARLAPLLSSNCITQRAEAACAIYSIAPEQAVKTLEEIVAGKDWYEGPRAAISLDALQGRLPLPFTSAPPQTNLRRSAAPRPR